MSQNLMDAFFPTLDNSSKECPICKKPLGPVEISVSRAVHFDCDKCELCGSEGLQLSRIEYCLQREIPVSHQTCYDTKAAHDLRNRQVTITQGHLDYLNKFMSLVWIESESSNDMEYSLDTLSKKVEIDSRSLLDEVQTMSFERAAKILTKMQALTAAVSIATSQNKEKAKLAIRERDIEKFRKVEKYRNEVDEVREKRKVEQRTSEEKKVRLAAERENPVLRDRRKAIASLVNTLGMTQEQAEAMITEQEKKRTIQ